MVRDELWQLIMRHPGALVQLPPRDVCQWFMSGQELTRKVKVLASVLADELHKRHSSLSEMNFHEALNALWDDWRDDANADRGGLVKRIEKLLK